MKRSIILVLGAIELAAQAAPEVKIPETKNRFGITLFNANQQNGSAGYHALLPYFGGTLQWDDSYAVSDARITNFRFEYVRTLGSNFALGVSYAKQLNQDFAMTITQQVGGPGARVDKIDTTYSYSASGFGLSVYYQNAITLGLGLDQKSESASFPSASNVVNGTGASIMGQTNDFSRLWARLIVGKRFDSAYVSPYIGLEYAKPLSSTNVASNAYSTDLPKALAPTNQLGFVVGLYF